MTESAQERDRQLAKSTPQPMQVPEDIVSWETFQWIIGYILAGMGALGVLWGVTNKRLWSVPEKLKAHSDQLQEHIKQDERQFAGVDKRFNDLSSKLDAEHQENRANLQTLRGDLLAGQRDVVAEVRDLRSWLMRRNQGGD